MHRDILQGTTCKLNFGTGFVIAWSICLSYCNHQLKKFEEDKRFGLYKQLYNYEKRDINTSKKFPCQAFPINIISLCHFGTINFLKGFIIHFELNLAA